MIAILVLTIAGLPLGIALSVSQPYYVVGSNGQVSMHCIFKTKIQPQEMQVSLYKGLYGKERICSTSVNISSSQLETNERVHCRANVSNGRVDLTIFGLKGEDTDIYRCRVDIIFPPPYLRQFGNGTLVYIPESPDCPTSKTEARIQEKPEITPVQTPTSNLFLLCAILIITTLILILQVIIMILSPSKSSHVPQIVPQKNEYSNFW
ncbi:T-cell-specific surface glycoprotein CD28 [Astyanax mexicanus]|uniref:T-cell-specific surface glycoprotein CD28-like n=1 Tax=Astyanax mexicanus TaxID=7994 RepID=A0A3B1K225_ASTMX|nr:T-cell-specific surface glycoprotein CD28 [Astyanax mexicanus]